MKFHMYRMHKTYFKFLVLLSVAGSMVSTSIFAKPSSLNSEYQSLCARTVSCGRPLSASRACGLNFLFAVQDNGIGGSVRAKDFRLQTCTRSPKQLIVCAERRRYAMICLFCLHRIFNVWDQVRHGTAGEARTTG